VIRIHGVAGLRHWRESLPATAAVGLVPTMGALHEGHLSLVRRSAEENERTVVSVFVNPAQFNEAGDLAAYPRDLERDASLLEGCGCDVLYSPAADEVYPVGFQTWVEVGEVADPLEGAARPGHFRGVATVVLKLVNQTRPQRIYFGQKDSQQLAVVRRMVRDLDVPVAVVPCRTVREADGLAMSSRNRLLGEADRAVASALYGALQSAGQAFSAGQRDPAALRDLVRSRLEHEPLVSLEYVSAADPETLRELESGDAMNEILLSLAARVGGTRLIDNVVLAVPADPTETGA
jgi:pantoate--beta-alanine ligase